jgi:hypothetical protein
LEDPFSFFQKAGGYLKDPTVIDTLFLFVKTEPTMNDDIERADSKSPSFKSRSTFMDDESMLLQALDSVGASAYGIICISVWILNEGSSQLIQPRNGFWVDPIFRRENRSDALEMLLDERRIDYAPARHLVPGEGVEGLLFSESLNTIRVRTSHIKRSSILRTDHEATDRSFAFRSLKPILDDEDQPYNRRLSLMIEAKIGKAIGFPFHHNSTKGIVVYMARETAREENLLSTVCIRYLLHSTQFISGLLVFLSTRRDSQKQIQEHLMGVYDRIRRKLLAVHHMKNYPLLYKSSIDHCEESPTNKIEKHAWVRNFFQQRDCVRRTLEQVHAWFQKCKGGNVPLPPPKSWASLRFTFCAVYIQLFVLYWVDDFIVKQSHGRFSLQRGTLGSNVSSLFLLTASPASQPRPLVSKIPFLPLCPFGHVLSKLDS